MKRIKIILCCILIINTFTYAHSGKTDSNGGHYNSSTGEYHYHHGYPAHSVCGVNCPYNNIDATNHNSSSSSRTSNYKKSETTKTQKQDYQMSFWEKIFISILLSYFAFPFTAIFTGWILSRFKNIYQKVENYIWFIGYIESILILYSLFS